MAKTVFSVVSRSTNQTALRLPEVLFNDVVVRDSDAVFMDPATSALDAALVTHKLDPSRVDYAPIILSCTPLQIIGLPNSAGVLTDVDLVTGGIGGANEYCYNVSAQPSDGRPVLSGYVFATDKLRNGSAAAWSSGTTYSTVGTQVLRSGHNYRSIDTGAGTNLNKDPVSTLLSFWKLDDISSAERAAVGMLTQLWDAAWSSGTTYALGAYAAAGALGTCYKSIQAANLNHVQTDTAWWLPVKSPIVVSIVLASDPLTIL